MKMRKAIKQHGGVRTPGVSLHRDGKYEAVLGYKHRTIYLGRFHTAIVAAMAVNDERRRLGLKPLAGIP